MYFAYKAYKRHRARKAAATAQAQSQYTYHPPSPAEPTTGSHDPQTAAANVAALDNTPTLTKPNTPQFRDDSGSSASHSLELTQNAPTATKSEGVSQNELGGGLNEMEKSQPESTGKSGSSWSWKKVWDDWSLVLALLLPVFLETLDYTGTSNSYTPIFL